MLAYSGGLDTSCAIAWLKEDYGFDEVIAVLVDVGQEADFEPAIQRGYAAGADDVILLDRKDAVRRRAGREGAARERSLRGQVPADLGALPAGDRARRSARSPVELGADAIVHGCTGKGNDQVRLELAFKATYPGVRVIAPLRDTPWTRDAEIAYAAERGIPVEAKPESPFSIDDNLFGRAIEAGVLEDPWAAPPEEAFVLTRRPAARPRRSTSSSASRQGLPVSLDGEELPLAELIAALNALAGARGIGRIDMIENRVVGIKSRELYEAPAALTLIAAHDALEDVVLTKAEQHGEARARAEAGRSSSTTASGSRRCARPTTRSSPRRRSS